MTRPYCNSQRACTSIIDVAALLTRSPCPPLTMTPVEDELRRERRARRYTGVKL